MVGESVPAPAQLLRELIRFDTTNPPGGEGPCVAYLRDLFAARGARTWTLSQVPGRPNLVVRVAGRGQAPPLLLQGHVDVVTTAGQAWTHPPFAGDLVDGWVWGRGALDMKGGVAMMAVALLRCLAEGRPPAGDVVLCCLADEEAGGEHGAQFLVDRYPDLLRGIRHGIGEGGASTQHIAGRPFYPIMVAEKRVCRLRVTLRGPGGHAAARSHRGGTMARLGELLVALDHSRLPIHVTPAAAGYVRGIAEALPGPERSALLALLNARRAPAVLEAMGEDADRFEPLLRHTVNATIVRGGEKINVLPSAVAVDLDGRMLPGFEPEQFISEVRQVIGGEPEVEILMVGPRLKESERGPFYHLLGDVLRELEPAALPVPLLMTGATDQRHFARLGIQGYGYLPLRLPRGFGQETVHAADERVPASALDFGTNALSAVLARYRG